MMRSLRFDVVCLAATALVGLALLGTGCEKPSQRLNAPPQGYTEHPHEMQDTFVHMTDNALLEDMSMSAVHFVPHQDELNATGVRRLKRYVEIAKVYGGTLRYDGVSDPDDLADKRLAQIREFLVGEGVEEEQMTVEPGLAGGTGLNADEVIQIRKAGNFKPDDKQGASTPAYTYGADKEK